MKTLTIYASTDSAFVAGANADYVTARSTATSHHQAIDPDSFLSATNEYKIMRSFLKFDTSVLPWNAEVVSARLRMTSYRFSADRGFTVIIAKHDWSGEDPITSANRDTAYDGSIVAAVDRSLKTISNATIETTFFSGSLDVSHISKSTDTYYSLYSFNDFLSSEPAADEYVFFHSAGSTSTANKPALIVNYNELSAFPPPIPPPGAGGGPCRGRPVHR